MKKVIFAAAIIIFMTFEAFAQEVCVIANKNISESSINAASLSSIFQLNKLSWSDGTKIKLADQKEGASKIMIYQLINKQEMEIKKQWLKKKLSEGIEEPKVLPGDDEVLNFVKSTPGALGYVSKNKVSDDVKVILRLK